MSEPIILMISLPIKSICERARHRYLSREHRRRVGSGTESAPPGRSRLRRVESGPQIRVVADSDEMAPGTQPGTEQQTPPCELCVCGNRETLSDSVFQLSLLIPKVILSMITSSFSTAGADISKLAL